MKSCENLLVQARLLTIYDVFNFFYFIFFKQQAITLMNTMKTTLSNSTSLSGLVAVMTATSDFVSNDAVTEDDDAVVRKKKLFWRNTLFFLKNINQVENILKIQKFKIKTLSTSDFLSNDAEGDDAW